MVTHHPTFDPNTGTWFLKNPPIEAGSLRLLLAKLGANAAVKDYYPNGIPFQVVHDAQEAEGPRVTPRMPLGNHRKPADALKTEVATKVADRGEKRSHKPQKGNKAWVRTSDEEKALDMWAQGLKGSEIGERLGHPQSWVGSVMDRGRAHGDPRAAVRMKKLFGRKKQRRL